MKLLALTYRELQELFAELQIPTDKPGFCDHPSFAGIEQADRTFLQAYGAFVAKRPYSRVRILINLTGYSHST